jgi:hypothetical protein
MRTILSVLLLLAATALAVVWLAGGGFFGEPLGPGTPTRAVIPADVIAQRAGAQRSARAEIGATASKQILFGDLHVHTTYSLDAFLMSLPLAGGDGAHPVADACDFARHCSALDFWSINDHALVLTPRRWAETVAAIRQCNEIAGDPEDPDVVAYLGWEWTQIGATPETHYGHKNVILRDLAEQQIPARPIASVPPVPGGQMQPRRLLMGAFALSAPRTGGADFALYTNEMSGVPECAEGVPVRDLPHDCMERAATPSELFSKLDEWGHESLVIPHGTAWGFYTPPGSSWDKQLTPEQHDPARQRLVEVFSGHGNSEQYRSWQEVLIADDGSRSCPRPVADYEPSCWRAGEIIRGRCASAGHSDQECDARAAAARGHFVAANRNAGAWTVPGYEIGDWLDAGQCRDCFLPAFNYRPRNSVQYMMALGRRGADGKPLRFDFGFIASSDNHSARPGTGYKEFARTELTEARFGNFVNTPVGSGLDPEPRAQSTAYSMTQPVPVFALWESERQSSFFVTGGLVAVHSNARDRGSVFAALQRKEVYGTSGPRILLWFDLINAGGDAPVAMGGAARMAAAPAFEVRALGSLEQHPGCPDYATEALGPDRLARLCQGECYNPSDRRRRITRIEVVRIRPQTSPTEDVSSLIEDPWRSFSCPVGGSGCRVEFSDDEFAGAARDALYYVRAIEEPTPTIGADPLRCERDERGNCVAVHACTPADVDDECRAAAEPRAWSSPITVSYAR